MVHWSGVMTLFKLTMVCTCSSYSWWTLSKTTGGWSTSWTGLENLHITCHIFSAMRYFCKSCGKENSNARLAPAERLREVHKSRHVVVKGLKVPLVRFQSTFSSRSVRMRCGIRKIDPTLRIVMVLGTTADNVRIINGCGN